MEIPLHACGSTQITNVSNVFIDYYMCDANGEYVKIYLYLLRHLYREDCSFDLDCLASDLGHTNRDIKRALSYWEKEGLLKLSYDDAHELSGIYLLEAKKPIETPVSYEKPIDMTEIFAQKTKTEEPKNNIAPFEEAAQKLHSLQSDNAFREILYLAERMIGTPISDSAVNTILYWYETLNFSQDLIEYLIEYCVEKQHPNFSYMNKVALAWKEEGIETVSDAKLNASLHADSSQVVSKAFALKGRSLAPAELEAINRWTKEYGFEAQVIEEACNRTMLKTHEANFVYADAILKNWMEHGVRNYTDIAKIDQLHSQSRSTKPKKVRVNPTNSFNDFIQHEYDYDALINKKMAGS